MIFSSGTTASRYGRGKLCGALLPAIASGIQLVVILQRVRSVFSWCSYILQWRRHGFKAERVSSVDFPDLLTRKRNAVHVHRFVPSFSAARADGALTIRFFSRRIFHEVYPRLGYGHFLSNAVIHRVRTYRNVRVLRDPSSRSIFQNKLLWETEVYHTRDLWDCVYYVLFCSRRTAVSITMWFFSFFSFWHKRIFYSVRYPRVTATIIFPTLYLLCMINVPCIK